MQAGTRNNQGQVWLAAIEFNRPCHFVRGDGLCTEMLQQHFPFRTSTASLLLPF